MFWFSSLVVLLDFILNIIWLPIGAHNTWGFRTAEEAFMSTYNGTGAPPGWNWCLSYLATAGILIGFDASGHVAEETKNASITAARGIFWSTVVSGIGGLATIILFLFCAVSPAHSHTLQNPLNIHPTNTPRSPTQTPSSHSALRNRLSPSTLSSSVKAATSS